MLSGLDQKDNSFAGRFFIYILNSRAGESTQSPIHSSRKQICMVRGIGTDIVEIQRIGKIIEKYGDQFLHKIFTEPEIGFCKRKAVPAIHFAGRWAAKEAFYKALPSSCQSLSSWKSVQVISGERNGEPLLEICSSMLRHQVAKESISALHLSISHEQAYCVAFVILEQN